MLSDERMLQTWWMQSFVHAALQLFTLRSFRIQLVTEREDSRIKTDRKRFEQLSGTWYSPSISPLATFRNTSSVPANSPKNNNTAESANVFKHLNFFWVRFVFQSNFWKWLGNWWFMPFHGANENILYIVWLIKHESSNFTMDRP